MRDATGRGTRGERILVFAGAGALATLAVAWLRPRLEGAAPPPGAPAIRVADRDGDRVLGLDAEGFLTRSVSVSSPLELAARLDGGVWVLAGEGSPPDPVRWLWRLTDRGELVTETLVPGGTGLVSPDGRDALLIACLPGGASLIRVGGDGRAAVLAPVEAGASFAAGPAGILVREERGVRVLGGGSLELPPGHSLSPLAPDADGWWAVEWSEGRGRLLHLDRNLDREAVRPLAELRLPDRAGYHLAPISRGGVWIVAPGGEALRVGPRGKIRARGELSLPGLEGCVATERGGLLAVVPGALLCLDPRGKPLPGQGGFDYLVAVTRAVGVE